jgi:hypothetical protein
MLLGLGVHKGQWRNVISGGPRFKLFEGPPSRSAKGTSGAPYMHKFSSGSRACSPGKFLNLDSLKCHFPDSGERFYRILMVRERHCCSIGYSLSLGAPIGVGGPRVLPVRAHSSYATDKGAQEQYFMMFLCRLETLKSWNICLW